MRAQSHKPQERPENGLPTPSAATSAGSGLQPSLRSATVLVAGAGTYLLSTPDGQIDAKRAAGCLIEPATGDHVLVADVHGAAFVLSVLERDARMAARMEVPGGLEVHAPHGRVSLAGQKVEITAATETVLTSPELEISTLRGKFFVDTLSMIGARLDADIGKVALVAKTIDTVAERLRQNLSRCYRFVKALDQLRAGTVDIKAESHARVHAYDTVVTADKLVKIDGSQIHMG